MAGAGHEEAKRIAAALREGGPEGIAGVRAIGLWLHSRGLAQVSRNENLPVLFGVVTAGDAEQAAARCGGTSNKGAETARAAIDLLATLREVR